MRMFASSLGLGLACLVVLSLGLPAWAEPAKLGLRVVVDVPIPSVRQEGDTDKSVSAGFPSLVDRVDAVGACFDAAVHAGKVLPFQVGITLGRSAETGFVASGISNNAGLDKATFACVDHAARAGSPEAMERVANLQFMEHACFVVTAVADAVWPSAATLLGSAISGRHPSRLISYDTGPRVPCDTFAPAKLAETAVRSVPPISCGHAPQVVVRTPLHFAESADASANPALQPMALASSDAGLCPCAAAATGDDALQATVNLSVGK